MTFDKLKSRKDLGNNMAPEPSRGWEIKKLGEIGKVCMCKRILKKQTLPVGDIPFYKIGTFGKTPNAFISKDVYQEYSSKYSFPKKGDILISASGTIGRRVIYDGEPAYFQDSNIVWIDNDEKEVLNSFLYKFYGFCNWNPSKGATISRLYNDDLRKIEIPVPPLNEQQRIVSILDQAFACIERSRNAAIKNLQNAKELFESYLQGVFENGDWEMEKWGEVLEIRSGRNQKEVEDPNGQYPILGSAGKVMGYASNFICEEGTTIVGRKGTIDNPMYIEEKFWNVDTAFGLHALNQLDKRFLFYFCRSYDFTKQDKGSGRPSLVKSDLLQITMPIPPFEEQQTIVRQLDALRIETQKLEAVYQKKIEDLEELKKSILQKAFAGELETEKAVVV